MITKKENGKVVYCGPQSWAERNKQAGYLNKVAQQEILDKLFEYETKTVNEFALALGEGYDKGYQVGYDDGFRNGYNAGLTDGTDSNFWG